ncbi:MAG: phage protease, partial [Phycisphaerae bacterium]
MTDSKLVNADCGWRVAVLLDDGGGQVLREIVLAPDGKVESLKGNFLVDAESGRLAQAALEERGTDIAIDYEHQSLGGEYSSPSGKAPAAGWIKRVWYETGKGLVAAVEWTEAAAKMIRGKEYKYLSPAAIIREEDGKLVAIDSGALTNRPAIRGMAALAASTRGVQEDEKELLAMADDNDGQGNPNEAMVLVDKLRGLLGLAKNTSVTETLKATVAKLDALLSDDEGDEGTD